MKDHEEQMHKLVIFSINLLISERPPASIARKILKQGFLRVIKVPVQRNQDSVNSATVKLEPRNTPTIYTCVEVVPENAHTATRI
jgi:hypothetical protein